jgi:hypothetical protein
MWTGYLVTSKDRIADGQFSRLVDSLDLSKLKLIVGCRGFNPEELPVKGVSSVSLPLQTSLSRARNFLLSTFPPPENNLIFFPDDDCWLAPGTLEVAEHWLKENDFLIGVVDTDRTECAKIGKSMDVNVELALEKTASAALFFRGLSLRDFAFDERLGLGATFRAAEDLDLILTLVIAGGRGIWTPDLRIGHPKKNRNMEYFPGSIAALKSNSRKNLHLKILALRRLCHGFLFAICGKLKIEDLILGIRALLINVK